MFDDDARICHNGMPNKKYFAQLRILIYTCAIKLNKGTLERLSSGPRMGGLNRMDVWCWFIKIQ